MIESFHHRGLKRFYERGETKQFDPRHVGKIRAIIALLDQAQKIEDMDVPTFRLHPLSGNYAGFWAVTVRSNWRIIFRLENGRAFDVELIDYH